ncbi:MAG UNVERIFIED_CONTAM: hypothetical protein LVT10_09910 [Anaerolineae bacterium]|jgi:hypothetical protein
MRAIFTVYKRELAIDFRHSPIAYAIAFALYVPSIRAYRVLRALIFATQANVQARTIGGGPAGYTPQ